MQPPLFDDRFRASLAELLAWRRDVRRFRREALPEGTLEALVALARLAPSVGLSEPWRFVRVRDAARRAAVRASHAQSNAAAALRQDASRAGRYAALKLAGLDDAPEQLAVFALGDPAQGHGLGRATMPQTATWSAVLAVHTLWLAARARGIGVGWVSILDPDAVRSALDVPADWMLVAYLCIGWPAAPSAVPELEVEGWERRRTGEPILQR